MRGQHRVMKLGMVMMLLVPLIGAGTEKSKGNCDGLKDGVGYYAFYFTNIRGMKTLDEKSAAFVRTLYNTSMANLMKDKFKVYYNLREAPSSLKDEDVVKIKMQGAAIDFDEKKLAQAAASRNLGYVVGVVFYPSNIGLKDNSNMLKGLSEVPDIEFNDTPDKLKSFNFLSVQVFLYADSGKLIGKSKFDMTDSYREWFMAKYPDFFSGKVDALPEGVDYNSSSQYQLFLQSTIAKYMDSLPDLVDLAKCKVTAP
jgi:hypothetical protein